MVNKVLTDEDVVPAHKEPYEFRVSNKTSVHDLATGIQRHVEEGKSVVLSCMGVAPNSTAVKAVAVANGRVAPQGFVFLIMPAFGSAMVTNKDHQGEVERTTIRHQIVKYIVGT